MRPGADAGKIPVRFLPTLVPADTTVCRSLPLSELDERRTITKILEYQRFRCSLSSISTPGACTIRGKGSEGRLLQSFPMKTANLDLLEKSELPPAQARAILQVMESELSAHDSALATKADLQAGLQALRADIETLRFSTGADIQASRLANKADLEALRADLVGEIKGTLRWNFAFWVAQLGAMAAILKLLK